MLLMFRNDIDRWRIQLMVNPLGFAKSLKQEKKGINPIDEACGSNSEGQALNGRACFDLNMSTLKVLMHTRQQSRRFALTRNTHKSHAELKRVEPKSFRLKKSSVSSVKIHVDSLV